MGLALLLLLLTVPVIEIAVFIRVGDWIGLWPTLALIILTAMLGSWQLRLQGMATLARARQQMDRGEIPTRELFDGLCLLAAGALLLTPGFVTDLLGASLFVPPVRRWLRTIFARHLEDRVRAGGARTRVFVDGAEVRPGEPGPSGPRSRWGQAAPPGTIEGEWTEVDEEEPGSGAVLPGPGPGPGGGPGGGRRGGPDDETGDGTVR